MDLALKKNLLDRIYGIFEASAGGGAAACHRGCAHCCTRDVLLSTLEGYRIMDFLEAGGHMDLLERVRKDAGKGRLIPRTTTNRLAACSLAGEAPPVEDTGGSGGICPLLTDDLCLIYPVRPFACRLMTSTEPCARTGYAVVPPLRLTINELFLQFIEHVDADGFTGNLSDMLLCLADADRKGAASPERFSAGHFVPNTSIQALLVPPEHRSRIMPILSRLRSIRVPAQSRPDG